MSEMTDEQRSRLGDAVRVARMERYETKLDAYRSAGINSQTWDRIESGLSVKERSLVAAIKLLWPSAGGDWREVPGVQFGPMRVLDGSTEDPEEDAYRTRLETWVVELQERIELVEKHVYALGKPIAASDPRPDETGDDGEDLAAEEGDSI